MVILDNLGIHIPNGSRLLRELLAELLADAERWARTINPAKALSQVGSPFITDQNSFLVRNSTMQHGSQDAFN